MSPQIKTTPCYVLRTLMLVIFTASFASLAGAGVLWWKLPSSAIPANGLCAVISAGNPAELVDSIAESSNVVVHCIVTDSAALEKLNRRIIAAGWGGRVTAELLPLTFLPYRDNMVNEIIVDDLKKATGVGLTTNELMRVLAPGGKLCSRPGATWQVVTKVRPAGMDEWTHPYHGPDGGWISYDKLVKFPVGLRWEDGLPFNISIDMHHGGQWTTTRGMALSGGRCFTMSTSEQENLRRTYAEMHGAKKGQDMFVTARDAWNGLLLWRKNLGDIFYGGLHVFSRSPFVAVDNKVFTVSEDQKLIVLDALTGALTASYNTAFIPGILLVDRNTVVAATWKEGAHVGPLVGIDRRLFDYSVVEGTVEAFDVPSGKKLWSVPKLVSSMRSADGNLYIIQRNGADKFEEGQSLGKDKPRPDRPEQRLMAFDLRTGKPLWEAGPKEMMLQTNEHVFVDAAGAGAVTVCHDNGKRVSAFNGTSGKMLFQANAGGYSSIYEGKINAAGGVYDPKTGERIGNSTVSVGATVCTPAIQVNGIKIENRGCGFNDHGKSTRYGASRGACMWASVPANGAFYTPQTWCACAPGQVPGFVSFGPIGHLPTREEMEKAPVVEKGPAFGKLSGRDATDADWPMYRHGADRGASTPSACATKAAVIWKTKLADAIPEGRIGMSWKESQIDTLSAPVVAGGIMVVSDIHRHQVVALDAATGKELWRKAVGGRVNTPPTLYKGACLFGSADGRVCAVDARTGALAWSMRMGPEEQRMMFYGQVESPWPVVGSVLVSNGKAYANAGRTTESDGGIIVRAFDPLTGAIHWSTAQDRGDRQNDILVEKEGVIQCMTFLFDAADGKSSADPFPAYERLSPADKAKTNAPAGVNINATREGFLGSNWRKLGTRRSGGDIVVDDVRGLRLAWNKEEALASGGQHVSYSVKKDGKRAGKWSYGCPAGGQIYSAVQSGNAAVIGGAFNPEKTAESLGFVIVLSKETGKKTAEVMFDAPLAYDGLAIADGRIYATFMDGTVACLGDSEKR